MRRRRRRTTTTTTTTTATTTTGRMRWTKHEVHVGEMRNAYRIFVGKPEGNRPLGRPRCRWEDNIRRNLREIGWEGVDRIFVV
jgi:hypothetical protein